MKTTISLAILLALALFYVPQASSHCEIPCGIYGDETRFELLSEHIATIEKSMKQIKAMTREKNHNQIVRWVTAKEAHAEKIQHIVNQYFLTQRIGPVDPKKKTEYQKYVKKLTLLHEMLVYAMKAKQTIDLTNVEKLKTLLKEFKAVYRG